MASRDLCLLRTFSMRKRLPSYHWPREFRYITADDCDWWIKKLIERETNGAQKQKTFIFELKMALHWVKGDNLPELSVPLAKDEAVDFQLKIMEWLTPLRNRLFTTHGPIIASFAAGYTGISIVDSAIRITGIGTGPRTRMGITFGILPGLMTLGLHKFLIRDNIIIDKWACPTCYHLKSAFIQVFFASICPTFFGGYYAFAAARKFKIPGIPPLNHRKEIMQCVRERVAPIEKRLKIYAITHFVLGAALAHLEAWETNKFNLHFEELLTEYHRKYNQL